jgi:hypothetical protein
MVGLRPQRSGRAADNGSERSGLYAGGRGGACLGLGDGSFDSW